MIYRTQEKSSWCVCVCTFPFHICFTGGFFGVNPCNIYYKYFYFFPRAFSWALSMDGKVPLSEGLEHPDLPGIVFLISLFHFLLFVYLFASKGSA